MRASLAGRALLLLSLALVGGQALPDRWRARAVRGEAALARAQATRLAAQTLSSQRAVAGAAEATPSEKVRRARRSLLEALEGLALDDVHLDVRQSQPEGSVEIKLAAQGRFVELVSATSRLAEPSRGLAFTAVRLSPRQEHTRLELEALCR